MLIFPLLGLCNLSIPWPHGTLLEKGMVSRESILGYSYCKKKKKKGLQILQHFYFEILLPLIYHCIIFYLHRQSTNQCPPLQIQLNIKLTHWSIHSFKDYSLVPIFSFTRCLIFSSHNLNVIYFKKFHFLFILFFIKNIFRILINI